MTELSILKQCLLFYDTKAAVLIYKLARKVPDIGFEDFFGSRSDIQTILERLPAQQYLAIFQMFNQNYHTKKIHEAILSKRSGKVANLTTFRQNSGVISN